MQRRSVLTAAGAVLVGGCTGTGGDGGSAETSTTTTSTTAEGDATITTTKEAGSVKGSSFQAGKSACGSSDAGRASISFGESSVSVAGTVVGNNGCFSARLSDVVYESAGGTCRVVVEAFDASDADEMCTQCVTNISYSASVSFEGALPATVEVVHDDMGGSSTVATASR